MAKEPEDVFVPEFNSEAIIELLRCKTNPAHFIFNYVKVVSPDEGIVPIKMNKASLRLLARIHKNKYVGIRSARQVGTSTINLAYILWYSLFSRERTIAIGSHTRESARELLKRIKEMYDRLPKFMNRLFIKNNCDSLEFDNRSRILTFSTTSHLKGYAISHLYIENVSFFNTKEIRELFNNILPVLRSIGHNKMVLSGISASQSTIIKNFTICKIPWHFYPGRNVAWKTNMIINIGWDAWDREFEVN